MPMATVVPVSVCVPRHNVGDSWGNILIAPGANVELGRPRRAKWPDPVLNPTNVYCRGWNETRTIRGSGLLMCDARLFFLPTALPLLEKRQLV